METEEIIKPPKKEVFSYIVITQCICVVLILLTVITVKYFFRSAYKNIDEWYKNNICIDTDINLVLSEGENNEI